LEPLKPPTKLIDLDSNPNDLYAIEKAARFVSMIPFVQDLKMFKDLPDMYSTCQEFIDLGGGDYEEHAILLANMFAFIDNKQNPGKYTSYLVFGETLPEGRNTFVMRTFTDPKDGRDIEIWSPITGECFFFKFCNDSDTFCGVDLRKASHMEVRINDPICPMKHIWFVVGQNNIWANIQKFDFPVLMNFDLTNKSSWKPLFETENHMRKFYPTGI
jgi:coiled-coil and C2 domain-containing protein 2A